MADFSLEIPVLEFAADSLQSGVSYLKQYSVNETFRLHSHTFYELFYIYRGKCIHLINDSSEILESGSLVFIRPGDKHKFEFLYDFDITIISCGIKKEIMEVAVNYSLRHSFFCSPPLPPHVILKEEDRAFTSDTFELLASFPDDKNRTDFFKSRLPQILYFFYKNDNGSPQKNAGKHTRPNPIWFTELISEFDKLENFQKGLDFLVKKSGVSQEHLTRCFHRYLSMSPTQYVNYKRVLYASDLLRSQKYTIASACYESGFHNLAYFYRAFRKVLGCTPKQCIINLEN